VMRGHLTFLAKLALSGVLMWFVLSRLTWTEVRAALTDPRWGWLGAAFVTYAVSALGGAQQWAWILRAAGLTTRAAEIRRLYFVGLFFNNFLPANIGGDAYKIVDLGRRENCPGRVFCATLLDRLVGLAALTMVAALAAVACLLVGIRLPAVTWVLAVVFVVLGGVLAVLVSRRLRALLPRLLERLRLPALAQRTAAVTAEFQVYRGRPGWLGRIFLFSLGVQTLRIVVHLLVAFGLRLDPTGSQVLQLAVLVPLLALSLTLPVTVNGIGLRETVSSALLVFTGLSAHGVVAMEMVAFLVMVLLSLSGGVLWWRGRISAPETAVARR
jgi:glycosyltransferase 2 family protein